MNAKARARNDIDGWDFLTIARKVGWTIDAALE